MKALALVCVLFGLAAAGPAKQPCDPFSSVHGCSDSEASPVAKRPFVKKPTAGVAAEPSTAHRTGCDPFSSPHGCSDDRIAQADPVPPPSGAPPATGQPLPPPPVDPAALRQTCVAAMNADPAFAASIVATADKQIDQKTIDAHKDAYAHIQKNEKHVIYAYAAMWVIAALLVAFLFLRQQALKAEIAHLRRDLKAVEDKA